MRGLASSVNGYQLDMISIVNPKSFPLSMEELELEYLNYH